MAMIYDSLLKMWSLKYYDPGYGYITIGETSESQYLTSGYILPGPWEKCTSVRVNGILNLKIRLIVEENVSQLQENIFDKIRFFSFSNYSLLAGMKNRILELFIVFRRLFDKYRRINIFNINFPEEMILKILENLTLSKIFLIGSDCELVYNYTNLIIYIRLRIGVRR